jgi:hypothetical protein
MISDPILPVVALSSGVAAVVVWALVFVRSLIARRRRVEQRVSFVLMSATALLASVGALASSIGFAVSMGTLDWAISRDLLAFVSSIGRGALFMAGMIVLTHYRPPRST